MTRYELGQSLGLQEDLIPEANLNRPGHQLLPKEIAIHNTDNTDPGADASAHARHLINNHGDSGYGPTSWHYTVDDSQIIKHLPLGEVGYHAYASGNAISVGIEICMNSDGVWESAVDRTARLVAALCFDFGWEISQIKQHNDYPRKDGSVKNCPSKMREEAGATWVNFISLAQDYLVQVLQEEGFQYGFETVKGVRSSSGDATTFASDGIDNVDNANMEDLDHGAIVIPKDLLSQQK